MKAYQMMMFLLIFNLTISLVGALHIYNMEYATGDEYDVGEEQSPEAISDTFFWKNVNNCFPWCDGCCRIFICNENSC